jgi:flagellar biosynthesis chaperone FliJ
MTSTAQAVSTLLQDVVQIRKENLETKRTIENFVELLREVSKKIDSISNVRSQLVEKTAEKASAAMTTGQYSDAKNSSLDMIIHEQLLLNHIVMNISLVVLLFLIII